jgi:hypothetical protein
MCVVCMGRFWCMGVCGGFGVWEMADNGRYDTTRLGSYSYTLITYTHDTSGTAVHLVHTLIKLNPSCPHRHQTPLLSFKFNLNTQRTRESALFATVLPPLTNKKKLVKSLSYET